MINHPVRPLSRWAKIIGWFQLRRSDRAVVSDEVETEVEPPVPNSDQSSQVRRLQQVYHLERRHFL